jgi:hypothetical protein
MADELAKRDDGMSPIQALRSLLTLSGDDTLAIAKSAVKDGKGGFVARGISVIQRWNEVRFGQALLDELAEMRAAGKIREDFHKTDAGASTLREFLEMIGEEPDEERFRAFCALFMSANAPDADDQEALIDLELMNILKSVSVGEMHLLSAIMKRPTYQVSAVANFRNYMVAMAGHNSHALMARHMESLIQHNLVSGDVWRNPGGVPDAVRNILTDLGSLLQSRVTKYQEFKQESVQPSKQ